VKIANLGPKEAEQLAQPALATGSLDRSADPPRGGHPDAAGQPLATEGKHDQMSATRARTTIIDGSILARPGQANRFRKGEPLQTAIRFRPFRRRALSTLRPPLVRIRTRNPWVFFRRLLCGWYVRFIALLLPTPYSQYRVLDTIPAPALCQGSRWVPLWRQLHSLTSRTCSW